jgi:hypothetical protein
MGIDAHGLLALEYASKKGANFNKVCTIGRQQIQIDKTFYSKLLNKTGNINRMKMLNKFNGEIYFEFYEKLFKYLFESKVTDSIDKDSYEEASIIHDMSLPFSSKSQIQNQKYSLIIDFGCLEHVFNVAVAFHNVINLCEKSGTILHVLPSNQMVGHGFYQFSPEFFFSMYSAERGFEDTEVFISELNNPFKWFRVPSTIELKKRGCYSSTGDLYVIVKTTKNTSDDSTLLTNPISQSDFVNTWENSTNPKNEGSQKTGNISPMNRLKSFIKNKKVLCDLGKKIVMPLRSLIEKINKPTLISNHKDLKKVNMIEILNHVI